MQKITQEDNLVIQSYITTSLLVELKNNKFVESDFFEKMSFGVPWFKDQLRLIGVDNQGCVLMTLYAMLVIPHEIVQKAFVPEYQAVNEFLKNHTFNVQTNYKKDVLNVDYIRHLRNAIAHARFEFRPNDAIVFSDEDKKNKEKFSADLSLKHLGLLVNQLQLVHVAYINQIQFRK